MMRYIFPIGLVAIMAGAYLVVTFNDTSSPKVGLFDYENEIIVAQGKGIYQEHCTSCHGENLQGQPNWRQPKADGKLPAPPHDETGHTWHHNDEQLFAITKMGTAKLVGNGYQSDMPGFEGTLSDEDIIAALSYIKSTWPKDVQDAHTDMQSQ